ncbi:MAG: orotidine-5'-phosphate decarboxylase [Saprospiraceae bacterium]
MNRQELIQSILDKKSFLCVGLDTAPERLPAHLQNEEHGVLEFNKAIIDATRDLCVAYKPNLAFYEAIGPKGWLILEQTIQYIGPGHLVIADAKRGDIGNTSKKYAEAFFNQLHCDAITIAPYMGADSVTPFLGFKDKWVIMLALTSNQGSADFQRSTQDQTDTELFEKVILKAREWAGPDELMFVVGATHPEAFRQIRKLAPDNFLLVPGIGAQGGDLEGLCTHGLTPDCGLLVNASRSILYASSGTDFATAARAEALSLQQAMEKQLGQHQITGK